MIRYIMLTAILMTTTNVFSQFNATTEKTRPSPLATVGGFTNGDEVTKNVFTSQVGIGIYWKNEPRSADGESKSSPAYTFKATGFQTTVIRNGASVFNTDNTGNMFNEKTKSFFSSLQPGDFILFSAIKAFQQDLSNKTSIQELTLKPLLYVIK